ncbi:MAG: hypothetical protein P8X63_00190 [Desulfuromonadaceae bacterium]
MNEVNRINKWHPKPSGLAPTGDLLFDKRQKEGKKRFHWRGALLSPMAENQTPTAIMTPSSLRGLPSYAKVGQGFICSS